MKSRDVAPLVVIGLIGLIAAITEQSVIVQTRAFFDGEPEQAAVTNVNLPNIAKQHSGGGDEECVNSVNQPFPSSYGQYRYTGVTSDAEVCSSVGTDIMLREGGSAVDAAIATMLCVGVVNLYYNGIGGGHIATIYERPRGSTDRELVTIFGRERAPAAATEDMFVNGKASSIAGGKSIGVPGEIKSFHNMWKRFGKLKWATLFEAAIRLADEGFKVERALVHAMSMYEHVLKTDENLREVFVGADGELLREGDMLVNKKFAETLRRIAADPEDFYTGQLAKDIAADIAEYDGIITAEDLANYKAPFKKPLQIKLKNGGYRLFNPPPPASGAILDFIMGILDGYDLSPKDVCHIDKTILTYHRIVEAFKYAYAKRSILGDEDFVDVKDLVANLTSSEFAESVRLSIDDTKTHKVDYYKPQFAASPQHGTTHMNVLAPDGSAVALTSTINYYFGAQARGRRTGIIFNDEMDDFSTPGLINVFGLPPSPTNFIVPGKVPQSSTCPTIVLNDKNEVVFLGGGAGGSHITTTVAFVMANSLWFDKDLQSATDTARIHHQLVPNVVYYEPSLDQRVVEGLKSKQHDVEEIPAKPGMSIVNSVRSTCSRTPVNIGVVMASKTPACIEAANDGRRGGICDGI
jgi:gamma-glutamyltranspeptidase/glutathione hydrolase/leukotriene-C4 hydrolase